MVGIQLKICKHCFRVMKEEELKYHRMLHEDKQYLTANKKYRKNIENPTANKEYRKKLTSKKKLQMKICKHCFHVMKEKEIKNHMILHEDKQFPTNLL